jgi:hypothetical protein
MIDIDNLTVKINKDVDHFKTRYHLSQRDMTDLLLTIGVDSYLKDLTQRNLNGDKTPYLANWHLRQGIKYYHQDLEGIQ